MAEPVPVTQPQTAAPTGAPAELRVNVVLPDGSSYSIPESELPTAIARGARIDTGEVAAKKGLLRGAEQASALPTVAQSAVQTLPFVGAPLSQGIATLTGKTAAEVEAEQTMHPLASALGTTAGVGAQVAATVATGGAEGAVAGSGRIAAMSPAARILARTAGGAAEGAFYGAGSAANEAWLKDQPLTAESMLAAAGGGALFGGALAGGFSIAGEGLGRAAGYAQKSGTAARAAKASDLVGQDLRALEEAGLTPRSIDQAFKEGILTHGQVSPLEMQTAVAARLSQVEQRIAQMGGQIEQSGQTVNLLGMVKAAAKGDGEQTLKELITRGAITAADETASIARVMEIRGGLLADKAAAGFVRKLDDKLYDMAFLIEPRFGVEVGETLAKQRDLLRPLARVADEAVASGHVPAALMGTAAKAGGAEAGGFTGVLAALGRQGDHLGAIGALASMAASANPAAAFVAMGAGNLLRRVAENPTRIAETVLEGLGSVATATNLTREELAAAVTQAVVRGAGPTSAAIRKAVPALGGVGEKTFSERALRTTATDADVQQIRDSLMLAEQNSLANGHPDVAAGVARQRALLIAALPPPSGNPNAPAALSRPQLGPSQKQVRTYNDTLRGLTQPLGVIARVGQGRASDTEVRTVALAYPALAARAGQMMLDLAAKESKPVALSTKRAVEILKGASFDPAVTPSKVARIQALAYAPAPAPGRGGAAAGGERIRVNQKGLSEIDLGDRISVGMMDASDEARGAKK